MAKVTLGPQPLIFPKPALLIGALCDGKPNFMTASWGGIACSSPAMLSVAVRPQRHTYKGILQTGAFSVNVPSVALARQTDYLGIASGRDEDKLERAGLHVFYGSLPHVPLLEECPVGLECTVEHRLELGSHVLFIGRILQSHVSEECLTEGRVDPSKVDPLVFGEGYDQAYYRVGERVAPAFSAGLSLRGKK